MKYGKIVLGVLFLAVWFMLLFLAYFENNYMSDMEKFLYSIIGDDFSPKNPVLFIFFTSLFPSQFLFWILEYLMVKRDRSFLKKRLLKIWNDTKLEILETFRIVSSNGFDFDPKDLMEPDKFNEYIDNHLIDGVNLWGDISMKLNEFDNYLLKKIHSSFEAFSDEAKHIRLKYNSFDDREEKTLSAFSDYHLKFRDIAYSGKSESDNKWLMRELETMFSNFSIVGGKRKENVEVTAIKRL